MGSARDITMVLVLILVICICFTGTMASRARPQPPALPPLPPGITKLGFVEYLNSHMERNRHLPSVNNDTLRIVNYDINMLETISGWNSNVDMISNDLTRLQATVMTLHAVPITSLSHGTSFNHLLGDLGYRKNHFNAMKSASFGNMIASKIELKNKEWEALNRMHSILGATIEIGERRMAIFCAQTSNDAVVERRVMAFVHKYILKHQPTLYFLSWQMSVKSTLVGNTHFSNIDGSHKAESVFSLLGWPNPTFTGWHGLVTNFILTSPPSKADLMGAYQYLTEATRHLPLVVDVHMPGAGTLVRLFSFSINTILFALVIVIFFILVTGFGVYQWIQTLLDPFY